MARGTLIPVQHGGMIPIEEIGPALDAGRAINALTRQGWRRVLRWQHNGQKATVAITTTAGYSVRVTHDHLIATGDDAWTSAGELEAGQAVQLAPEDDGAQVDAAVPVPAWDRHFDRRGFAHTLRAATFPEAWSHDLGVVLGFLVGDGHFRDSGRAVEVGAGPHKLPSLQVLDRIITQWTGHGASFDERERVCNISGSDELHLGVRAIWNDVRLGRYLMAFGYGPGVGSPVRRAPTGIFSAPRAAILGFLSGLFSSDGSVHVNADGVGAATLWTTSPGLAHDVQMLATLLGARTSCSPIPREVYRTLYAVTFKGAAAIRLLQCANLLDDAKRAALSAARVPDRRRHRDTRVASVISDGIVTDVYDIEVEGAHEFSAHGIIVHNCQTYSIAKKSAKSCRNALAPDGKIGCRACWIERDLRINYTVH